jgi:hypothetical protein
MAIIEQERFLKVILLKMRNPLNSPPIFKKPIFRRIKNSFAGEFRINRTGALVVAIIWFSRNYF